MAKDAGFFESFRVADDILRQAVQGISDIITIPGIINRDFADVKAIMAGMGYAVMGTATAKGDAPRHRGGTGAIASPLLEAGAIDGARGILINITGSSSLRLAEVNEASTIIQSAAHEDANIIFGAVLDEKMKDEVKITVIATGFKETMREREHRDAFAGSMLHHRNNGNGNSAHATYEVAPVTVPERVAPVAPVFTQPTPEPKVATAISYVPEISDDYELGSGIVRHAAPIEEYPKPEPVLPAREELPAIETVSSSVNIKYDSDDLEIPAFLRKRGDA